MKPDANIVIPLVLSPGWNHIVDRGAEDRSRIRLPLRRHGRQGPHSAGAVSVYGPEGGAGWAYAGPLTAGTLGESGVFPNAHGTEEETGMDWLPRTAWSEGEADKPNFERIFGLQEAPAVGYAWSRLKVPAGVDHVEFKAAPWAGRRSDRR